MDIQLMTDIRMMMYIWIMDIQRMADIWVGDLGRDIRRILDMDELDRFALMDKDRARQ